MDQWAVVTGAGSGIGRAIAVELATRYAMRVLAVGRRLGPLQATQALAKERIALVSADVSTDEGRKKIAQSVPPAGTVKFLIHNAAVLEPVKPLRSVTTDEWRRHFAVNVEGPLFLTQQLLPFMEKGTRILHVSSGAAHHAYAGWGAYCSSKAALHMLYRVWNLELKDRGIRVGSVRPGVVDTPMQDRVRQATPDTFPALDKFLKLKEEGKLLDPQTVARFIGRLLTATDDETFSEQEWDIREHRL